MYWFDDLKPLERRDYQLELVDRARQGALDGFRRVILQAPTGSGKTACASHFIRLAAEKGSRVLFLAHARELIRQACHTLARAGVRYGVILRGYERRPEEAVQVASKDTVYHRVRRKIFQLPPADLIVVDEAHLSLAKTWQAILKAYPGAVVLGLTATPARPDGKPMSRYWQGILQAALPSTLIAQGYLVPTRVWQPFTPDLHGVKTQNGDWVPGQKERAVDHPRLVGDLVEHWQDLAQGRQTIVRAAGIQHSLHIRDAFVAAGIACEHADGKMRFEDRDGVVARFRSGEIKVLTQCNIVNVGFDCPEAGCLVDADPTQSYVKFRQGAGRIQRPAPGKEYGIYLDHAGNVARHSDPDADVDWKLGASRGEKAYQVKKPEGITCPNCFFLCPKGSKLCPSCGKIFLHEPKHRSVVHEDGVLVELDRQTNGHVQKEADQRLWNKALGVACNGGRTAAAAAAMFKQWTGRTPWSIAGLRNVPETGRWNLPVSLLFPQFKKGK